MNPTTDWLPGLIVLGTALLTAAAFVALRRWKPAPADPADARRHALEAEYRSAIAQLKELGAEKHHMDPTAFEAERAVLEKRAADALRAMEAGAGGSKKPAEAPGAGAGAAAVAGGSGSAAPAGFFGRHPEWKGALWGGGTVAFFGLLGFLLFREQKPAEPTMGGGQMAGAQAQGSAGAGAAAGEDEEFRRALEQAQRHPEDTDTTSMVAHELIRRQEWEQAQEITERTLGADPFHVENRIHRAVLRSVRGDHDAAALELEHLANTYPGSHEALLFLAALASRAGQKAQALEALERYVQVAPPQEQSPQMYQAITQLRAETGQAPP
jgi:tetratricopeptide (TPR) repeat protein